MYVWKIVSTILLMCIFFVFQHFYHVIVVCRLYGRPGNALLKRDGLMITKLFKKNHAGMHSDVLFEIEKNVLMALEKNTPIRCQSRRHFPKLQSLNPQQRYTQI